MSDILLEALRELNKLDESEDWVARLNARDEKEMRLSKAEDKLIKKNLKANAKLSGEDAWLDRLHNYDARQSALSDIENESLNTSSSSFDNDVKDSYEALISSGKVEYPTIEDIFVDMSNPDNYDGRYADWDASPDPRVYRNARAAIVDALDRLGINDIDESLNEDTSGGNSSEDTFEAWYQLLSEEDQIIVDELADEMELPNYEDCTPGELAQLHDNFVSLDPDNSKKLIQQGLDLDYGNDSYQGDDFVEEMLIDDPIENVKDYIDGEFNVENVVNYYLGCAEEADIYLSTRQIDLLNKRVKAWFDVS